jgi:hypothetical protein
LPRLLFLLLSFFTSQFLSSKLMAITINSFCGSYFLPFQTHSFVLLWCCAGCPWGIWHCGGSHDNCPCHNRLVAGHSPVCFIC